MLARDFYNKLEKITDKLDTIAEEYQKYRRESDKLKWNKLLENSMNKY